jgi:hypothetical protein
MGFWGATFGGSNPTLNKDIEAMGGLGTFLSNTGTKDIATSSKFMNTLLSGNTSEVSTLLAPQVEGIQKRNQQQKQQLGEFGGRSGGTTGAMLASDDDVHAQINDLVSKLTGAAVSNLGTEGSNLVAQGAGDLNSEANLSQIRMQNWKSSILGKGLSTAAQAAEAYAMGGVGGMLPGGPGGAAGGQGALASFLNG